MQYRIQHKSKEKYLLYLTSENKTVPFMFLNNKNLLLLPFTICSRLKDMKYIITPGQGKEKTTIILAAQISLTEKLLQCLEYF